MIVFSTTTVVTIINRSGNSNDGYITMTTTIIGTTLFLESVMKEETENSVHVKQLHLERSNITHSLKHITLGHTD